jgi:DNA (cytosine-5)-methyltransferase 1
VRYASFFSGIEMASLAFEPLGWEPVAFAEVDPFACAVLAHHYPHVPNLGDVSKITEEQIADLGHIDLIIGGFPCQDVSNAGKRKGLRNEDGTSTRSGLFFDAMRHVRVAHRRCGLRWLVLENVHGLYSSNAGRDFGAVVGEIVGSTVDVPGEGWQDTGAAAGPRGMVEWCCLDSQWRGLAQRRERVFFVADFGDWADRPPVLLERESLSGDPPACVAARQKPAARTSRGTGRKGIWRQIAEAVFGGWPAGPAEIAGSLAASDGRNGEDDNDAQAGRLIPEASLAYGGNDTSGPRDIATCLNAKGGGKSHGLRERDVYCPDPARRRLR